MANHYQILGVSKSATQAEIKRAYRGRARASHPDHHPHPDAARRFAAVQRAYQVLSNPVSRRRYDLGFESVRVRQRRNNTAKQPTTAPPRDDRKYGTRHRYTNPPPTKAEQEQKYLRVVEYYSLFTKKGMRLPRKEWWNRFSQITRRWPRREPGSGGFFGAMAAIVFGVYLLLYDNESPLGVFWLLISLFFLRSAYINTVGSIASGETKN